MQRTGRMGQRGQGGLSLQVSHPCTVLPKSHLAKGPWAGYRSWGHPKAPGDIPFPARHSDPCLSCSSNPHGQTILRILGM